MLPLRLTLENFLPYRGRQAPLDFTGLGIACLAGENGAGKSSILDGITWCLWGRSRAGASADPLVSAGESEMAVELEFTAGEGRYRVIRRHRRPRGRTSSGLSALELQAWDGEQYRAQTSTRSRETQEQIIALLRLDYDTFVNTAFLVQGRADLFTTMRPADRKRLLGEVLGLSHYEDLADRARVQARERESARRAHQVVAASFEDTLEREPQVRQDLETTTHELEANQERLGAVTDEARTLQGSVAMRRATQSELERLSVDTARLEREFDRLQAEIVSATARAEAAQATVERAGEIQDGYSSLLAARAALTDHGERARGVTELTSTKPALEAVVEAARTGLERDLATTNARAKELEVQASRKSALQQRLTDAENRRQQQTTARSELTVRSDEREALGRELESKRVVVTRLQEESKRIQESLAIVESPNRPDEICPVCGTELGTHGLERVKDHYAQRKSEVARETTELTAEGRLLRERYDELGRWVRERNVLLQRESAEIESEAGAIQADMRAADVAEAELPKVQEDAVRIRGQLERGQYAGEERSALEAIEQQIMAVDYDSEAHAVAHSWAVGLERWDAEHRALDDARSTLASQTSRVTDLNARRDETEARIADLMARAARLTEEVDQSAGMPDRLANLEATAGQLSQLVSELERRKGALERDTTHIAQQRASLMAAREDERRSSIEKGIYDELTVAFGVRGIQALLVETAIPEIEEEANRLLSAMTDNRMHLRLDTQRETQGGAQRETLEVMISDEWGTRPYEMFSGGEAFRINFALRVSLSQVLARRSGAEVPLLFIDEGFGTQDTVGRQRLVEAVSTLWREPAFQGGLILVITHIDEIKNQFDSRIEVTKTESGSRFEVVA